MKGLDLRVIYSAGCDSLSYMRAARSGGHGIIKSIRQCGFSPA